LDDLAPVIGRWRRPANGQNVGVSLLIVFSHQSGADRSALQCHAVDAWTKLLVMVGRAVFGLGRRKIIARRMAAATMDIHHSGALPDRPGKDGRLARDALAAHEKRSKS
jgi:hypothetical protein